MRIAVTAWKEKVRKKELYIISIIGIILVLLFGTGNGSLSIDGVALTEYHMLAPVLLAVVNAISCMLAAVMSLGTIPNEYERKTSHLIWMRGISQARYHGELAMANVLVSLAAEGMLFVAFLIFQIVNQRADDIWRLGIAYLIVGINVMIVSLLTSTLSICVPKFVAGVIVTAVSFCGVFYSLLELLKDMIGGFGGELMKYLLKCIPNLHDIQSQAGHVLLGETVHVHSIFVGLLVGYICVVAICMMKKKEA